MTLGFQILIQRNKRGKVTGLEYHGAGNSILIVFNKAKNHWGMTYNGKTSGVTAKDAAYVLRGVSEALAEKERISAETGKPIREY